MQDSPLSGMRDRMVAVAQAQHAPYPQYKGHWQGWGLVEITKQVKTKLGVAFEKGDVALYKPETAAEEYFGPNPNGKSYVTAYSSRNRIDTSVPLSSVGVLMAPSSTSN